LDSHELAWAAGFFDGEGWTNHAKRGVRARINQADSCGVPEVLIKFRRIVGAGRINGPQVIDGKKDLYRWEATSRADVAQVAARIGPWLCETKRRQFERTLRESLAPIAWPGSMSEELAWAGGFFDGEGSTYLEKHRTHPGHFYPVLYVPQSASNGTAPELLRLKSAVGDIGRLSGLRRDAPQKMPYRRWRVVTAVKVQAVLHLLWPFIGNVKRSQAQLVMKTIHGQPDLPRGNPAFGVAGARYCLRGHDKWNARVRPFRSRGIGREDNYQHQCLVCVREAARARRLRRKETDGHKGTDLQ
jgi:hypothetical protein